MQPDIFINDFERTENSDYIHGVIGRCLIVATRFDSMCVILSLAIEVKMPITISKINDEYFNEVVNEVVSKYRSLNNSIQSLKQPEEISLILYSARDARNEIAHSLTKGLEGCLDLKINNKDYIDEISRLIDKISDGDLIISSLLTLFNSYPSPNPEFLSRYKVNVLNWVIEQ
jgi:hypothetical protein